LHVQRTSDTNVKPAMILHVVYIHRDIDHTLCSVQRLCFIDCHKFCM